MNLAQIIQFERSLNCLYSRLGPCLEPDMRKALEIATQHAAEVRHYAVTLEDAESLKGYRADDLKEEARDRLVRYFSPDASK